MLFTEMVQQLRAMLGDYEEVDDFDNITPPQYTDDRLSVLLAISIKQVQTQLRIPKGHRLTPTLEDPYLDPWYDINDDFAHLVMLKALCTLQTREIEQQFGSAHVRAKLGPTELSTGAAAYGTMPRHVWDVTSPCAEYQREMMTWITFDPRKLHAVYAILPINSSGMVGGGREQGIDGSGPTMIQ